jgi:hypothetical protein
MGIFIDLMNENSRKSRNSIFNEIEAVNPGQEQNNDTSNTDYTADGDDNQDEGQEENDNPADSPEDYTVPDEGEDQTPEEANQNAPDEGTQADPNGSGEPTDDDGGGEDYTDDGGDMGGGDGGGAPEGGEDEGGGGGEDYTDDGGGEGGDDGGDAPPEDDGGGDDDYGDDAGGGEDDDQIKQLEDELFSKFNSAQINIMSKELKTNFTKIFEMTDDLIDRINDIPKVMSHIKIIEFVSNKLAEIRDMVSDYVYYTFDTKSYVENKIAYEKFMLIIRQINEIIAKIPSIKESK